METSELKLVFVAPVVELKKHNTYTYDLYFSDTPEIVWSGGWDNPNPAICDEDDIYPQEGTYSYVQRINSGYKLGLAMRNSAYPMLYCINGIMALSWIDLNGLEEYPENGRGVFKFGDDYEYIQEKLKELEKNIDKEEE